MVPMHLKTTHKTHITHTIQNNLHNSNSKQTKCNFTQLTQQFNVNFTQLTQSSCYPRPPSPLFKPISPGTRLTSFSCFTMKKLHIKIFPKNISEHNMKYHQICVNQNFPLCPKYFPWFAQILEKHHTDYDAS